MCLTRKKPDLALSTKSLSRIERTIHSHTKCIIGGRQSGLVVTSSTHDLKVVGSKLVSSKLLDGNEVKAMPGSIPSPNSGSFENKKIQVAEWVI